MTNMTNVRLAEAFLERARARLDALDSLRDEADLFDVVREARDIVDLCFRSMLRVRGIEVSRWQDVGEVLERNLDKFPADVRLHEERLLSISRDLQELPDLLPDETGGGPPERPGVATAERATDSAAWVAGIARLTIDILGHHRTPVTPAPG